MGSRSQFRAAAPQEGAAGADVQKAEAMQIAQRGGLYASLRDPKMTQLPPDAFAQRFTYSPAPSGSDPGSWAEAAPLPLPRSEMAWATADARTTRSVDLGRPAPQVADRRDGDQDHHRPLLAPRNEPRRNRLGRQEPRAARNFCAISRWCWMSGTAVCAARRRLGSEPAPA